MKGGLSVVFEEFSFRGLNPKICSFDGLTADSVASNLNAALLLRVFSGSGADGARRRTEIQNQQTESPKPQATAAHTVTEVHTHTHTCWPAQEVQQVVHSSEVSLAKN